MLGPVTVIETEEGLPEDALGLCDYTTRTLRVRPGLHEQQRQQVLNHEWIHMLLWDAGLHTALKRKIEEQVCDVIATALVASQL